MDNTAEQSNISLSKIAEKASKPSILMIGPSFPFRGGIAHYTTLLYQNLKKEFQTTFIAFSRQYFKIIFPGKSDRDNSRDTISDSNIERSLDTLNPFTWLKAGIRSRSYDVIILPWWVIFWAPYYWLLLLLRQKDSKLLFLCHNVVEHEEHPIKRMLSKLILRRGDAFIVHSKAEKERLEELLGTSICVSVSPHPSYDIFDKQNYDQRSARDELAIAQDVSVALFFGFIRPYKGLEVLLNSWKELDDPTMKLLIVGESWNQDESVADKIAKLGLEKTVTCVEDYVPNEAVELYFKASDFLVLPYLSGTGSGIAQIAYGMDKPIVGTDIGAFEDVIVNDKTGLLVPPGDTKALRDALTKMKDKTLRAEMTAYISEYKKRYEWSEMVKCIQTTISVITSNDKAQIP